MFEGLSLKEIKKKIGMWGSDFKVDVKMSIIKPLHAKWINEIYHHLKPSKQIVISRFWKVHIAEDVSEAD